jgi:iron complex outermembrane receptor protein
MSYLKSMFLAGVASVSMSAATVFAQDATDADAAASGQNASDIIVTARRSEERLQDVPISITVFDQEQLNNRNISSSADLAAYTPSLSLNGRYGPEKASFAIRGFSQDLQTQPTVGVYFADAPALRLNSNLTSGNGAGIGSMFDLQNVQVLKGPQGTLFGRNTTGGAILLVPKRPTDKLEGYVEGTIGNYDAMRIEGVLNLPISDQVKVRFGIDRNRRDGYINNKSGVGPKDFNDLNYIALRMSVLAEITPDLENYTVAFYGDSDTNGTVGKYAFCNRGTKPGTTGSTAITRAAQCAEIDRQIAAGYGYYDVANSDPDAFLSSTNWQAINTTTWRASDNLTVKNILSYGQSKESYSFNIDGDFIATPFVTVYPGQPDASGKNRPVGNQWTFTEELQFQGRTSDDALTWQAGGYLEKSGPIGQQEQYTSIYGQCTNIFQFKCAPLTATSATTGATTTVGSVSIARNNYDYHDYGLYAQATYKIIDQLSITAGIRNTWDYEKLTSDNITVVPSPTGPVSYRCQRAVTPTPNPGVALLTNGACAVGRSFEISSNKPTWLIDLEFKPVENVLVYAKYARGYRAGGINESAIGAETWKPEKLNNYELGLKASFQGAVRGTFNLAGFWNDFTDQQATVLIPQCTAATPGCTAPASAGINGIQNIGKSRLRGIEAEGSLMAGDFRFDFGYSFLDAKVTGGSVPFCDNRSFICSAASFLAAGNTLPYAPRNRLTVTGTYDLPVDESLGNIALSATFTHTDQYFSSHAVDAAFAAGAVPYNSSIAPSTDILNLNFNWNSVGGSPIDVALFVTNLTDDKYHVSSAGTGLASTGADFLILGQPRMFGGRVKFNF